MGEAQRQKDELVKNMVLLQQETKQLEAEKESLQEECRHGLWGVSVYHAITAGCGYTCDRAAVTDAGWELMQ